MKSPNGYMKYWRTEYRDHETKEYKDYRAFSDKQIFDIVSNLLDMYDLSPEETVNLKNLLECVEINPSSKSEEDRYQIYAKVKIPGKYRAYEEEMFLLCPMITQGPEVKVDMVSKTEYDTKYLLTQKWILHHPDRESSEDYPTKTFDLCVPIILKKGEKINWTHRVYVMKNMDYNLKGTDPIANLMIKYIDEKYDLQKFESLGLISKHEFAINNFSWYTNRLNLGVEGFEDFEVLWFMDAMYCMYKANFHLPDLSKIVKPEQTKQDREDAKYVLKTHKDGSVTTVADVHDVLLEMLKMIDKICKYNGITYWLNGGSALGAYRHKGFIPWDDDADIAMMREDYEKFIKVLQKYLPDDYYFQCFETHKEYNVLIPAMKIRKKNTYLKEVNTLLSNKCKDGDGIFVDVFVYDNCTTNKRIDLPYRIFNQLLMPPMILMDNLNINPIKMKELFVDIAKKYGKRCWNSDYIGFDLTWTFKSPLKPFIFKEDDILPPQYVEFEDTKLPVANHIHEYLCTAIAPSYNILPPESKRKPKHIIDINLRSDKSE